MQNARLDEAQAGIKIARRNINNLRYVDNTTLKAEHEEKLKILMMKEESEKFGLKLNIQKTKIMASCPITSWQTDGEIMETEADFLGLQNHCRWWLQPWNSKMPAPWKKAKTNLESILKSREWQQASVHGRERAKVRGLQPTVWARPLEFTVAAILVTVPNMSLVKRDFLSSCSCKEREGLWTTAHQGTCLMKVTLSVLWTWNNCKLSIYKWSLLNPILHECWNACTTYKAESCWLRNIGL